MKKSSFLRGSSLAPPLIRKAYYSDSANYFTESGIELRPDIWDDKGDYEVVDYFDIEKFTTRNLYPKQPLITLGGDHSITYPILKAITNLYGP